MKSDAATITCPQCGRKFALDEAIAHELRERMRAEFRAEVARREHAPRVKEQDIALKVQEIQALRKEQEEERERLRETLSEEFRSKLAS